MQIFEIVFIYYVQKKNMFKCLTISLNVSTYLFYDRKPKQQLLDVFYFIFEY